MIEPCPPDFWDRVAKLLADRIMLRESSLATLNLSPQQLRPVALNSEAIGAKNALAAKSEPPEGPRAA